MLSFIRRIIYSKFGVVITLGVLAVIAIAFAAGDITGTRQGSAPLLGGTVAEVGDAKLGEADMRSRVQSAFSIYRQQQPSLDIATFVTQGGMDAVIDRTINGLALEEFGRRVGVRVGKRSVDGEIASIPAFQGLDGKFNQKTYEGVIAQQRLTDRQVREDIGRDIAARYLLAPTAGASQVAEQFALPYASLLLERRRGAVGYIPAAALGAGAAPTDAELQAWYTRQRARYTVPERRTVRYAVVRAEDVARTAQPTDAEVAAAYAQQRARFAASEQRDVAQVIVADQAGANALAAKVRGGAAIAAAAQAAGLEANTLKATDRAALARAGSQALADAAFAAPRGGVVGPLRTPLGWAVAKVEAITTIPARTLDQARPELAAELAKRKAAEALAALNEKLDTAASEGATFDEVIADAKLKAETTPPLFATGLDPASAPNTPPDPVRVALAQAAFGAEQGDAPQLVPLGADGSFAVAAIGQIQPAAPKPLAEIRDRVAADFIADRNFRAARTIANAALAKVDKGMTLAQALAETRLKLPPVQPIDASRAELARAGQSLPPPVTLMFSMAAGRTKLAEAPNRSGWFVVHLDAIQPGNAAGNAALLAQTRRGLGGVMGNEYAQQFTNAVRKMVGVKKNDAAIAKLRGELTGAAGGN